ncbi:MAG: hypothetical protein JST00_07545 [Deltaproteobacteria bacterium]|nr:hypothetical protein [Deltaproteobacteria bacterium]
MHRSVLSASLVIACVSFATVVSGCGSAAAEDEAPTVVHPAPSEDVVFDAQPETKGELGIAKWGFSTDEAGDRMTYRGYGADNEVLTEVVQTLDRSSADRWYFTMKASGKLGSATTKIEYFGRPAANGKDTEIVMLVTETSFEETSGPGKVLTAFKADAVKRGALSAGGGSLVGKSRPMNQLVDRCQELVDKCKEALIDQRIAAAAASGDCGLLKRVGVPLVSAVVGGAVGGALTAWTGPGALAGGVIGGIAGYAGGAAGAELQCAASRRDATAATNELNQCRREQAAACKK